ncbi:NAD-dependent epimerase/dehydratase family protein [Hungatella effluvii]|uniref:NAD-dependent epimerase/dehydratase family protein n=1 Tax=Hungatella effluvii TaxID=1096246 RepID=UPI0022E5B01C|nr:NAD(P)-dependent oxidoreductase [Hungatella effluvii]
MKIFITGAGGFLGKNIIRKLINTSNHAIYATSLNSEIMAEFESRILFIPNDAVSDFDFSEVDIVINCAFPRAADGAGYAQGLDFLNELFKKIQPHTNCGMIDISSQSLYSSMRTEAAAENTQKVLEAVYDVGKYCMEILIDARLADHKRVHLRLASLIGPKFDQRIINRFVKLVIAEEDITINGGQQLFGFLDVRDCADAICAVINQWDRIDTSGQVYNVGAEESNSLKTIADIAVQVGSQFGYDNSKVLVKESDEWKNTSLDGRKFYNFFSWKPQYKLVDTTKSIYEYDLNL